MAPILSSSERCRTAKARGSVELGLVAELLRCDIACVDDWGDFATGCKAYSIWPSAIWLSNFYKELSPFPTHFAAPALKPGPEPRHDFLEGGHVCSSESGFITSRRPGLRACIISAFASGPGGT